MELKLKMKNFGNLSATLQIPNMSAAKAQKLSRRTVDTIDSFREEAQLDKFWDDTLSDLTILEVDNTKLPRKRKSPQRIEDCFNGSANLEFYSVIPSYYRQIY